MTREEGCCRKRRRRRSREGARACEGSFRQAGREISRGGGKERLEIPRGGEAKLWWRNQDEEAHGWEVVGKFAVDRIGSCSRALGGGGESRKW